MSKKNHSIKVLVPTSVHDTFTYSYNEELSTGQLVDVNFRNRVMLSAVWKNSRKTATNKTYKGPLKPIIQLHEFSLDKTHLDFISWVSDYTMAPIGQVLKMILSVPDAFTNKKTAEKYKLILDRPIIKSNIGSLSTEQQVAATNICRDVCDEQFQPFLLDGVTGSGKTEVYFEAIAACLQKNKQSLILLPEIALTTQWLQRFEKRFGCKPLQWHSGLTPSVRRQTWRAVLEGNGKVIVGARSALFLPFNKLGLIIVDEEHESTYKQDEQILYNARDMAVVCAKFHKIPIVLASATPSLETFINAVSGKYKHLELTERFGSAKLPEVKLINLQQEKPKEWISESVLKSIKMRLNNNEQSMLFLNRRGYAPLTICESCGYRIMCPACDTWLVSHKSTQRLHCHHCDYQQPYPATCPECNTPESLIPCGPGVERITEVVANIFPRAKLATLTSDVLSTPKKAKYVIDAITNNEIDIVIGTQVLAKGYHFPNLTYVSVIDGDLGLTGADIRACERTYQLLNQVSGRAGREAIMGEVAIQTYNPDHPVMQAIKNNDRNALLNLEAQQRAAYGMPPYGRLIAIVLSSLDNHKVEQIARELVKHAPQHPDVTVLGPIPAPLTKLRSRYRWRLLVKGPNNLKLQNFVRSMQAAVTIPTSVRMNIDVDPYNFL